MIRTVQLAIVLVLMSCAMRLSAHEPPSQFHLTETETQRWYRGNLHTHSHWSDGDDYLESIALWYREHGYQFLVFTDHNVLPDQERWVVVDKTRGGRRAYEKLRENFADWIEERGEGEGLEVRLRTFDEVAKRFNREGEYLLIQGEEISDRFHSHPIHLNASNIETLITPRGGNSVREVIQNNVDAVLAQREETGRAMLVHLNHPNFGYAVKAEDLAAIIGEQFFEVYNGHPSVHNSGDATHVGTERMWDIVLTLRLAKLDLPVMFGLAVDDGHNYHDLPSRKSNPGRGWVYVLSEALTPEALISAMEHGRFYASSGVELKRIQATEKDLTVEVMPREGATYTIEFVGTRRGFDDSSRPVVDKDGKELDVTRQYSESVGELLQRSEGLKATYRFNGDELYVRARVISSEKHPNPSEPGEFERAWTQPVVLKGR